MQDLDTLGGRGAAHPAATFQKYKPAKKVWQAFLLHWEANNPGEPLPPLKVTARMTGLSLSTVRRFLRQMNTLSL